MSPLRTRGFKAYENDSSLPTKISISNIRHKNNDTNPNVSTINKNL